MYLSGTPLSFNELTNSSFNTACHMQLKQCSHNCEVESSRNCTVISQLNFPKSCFSPEPTVFPIQLSGPVKCGEFVY